MRAETLVDLPQPKAAFLRRPIAVILSRYPLITEAFIMREVQELQAQGQPVRLVPLMVEHAKLMHPEAKALARDALFTPFLSLAIIAANLRMLRRDPRRYGNTLNQILWGTAGSPGFALKSLAFWPKAVYLAECLEGEGIRHVHAHYATHPATVAFVISALTPLTFSFTVHAHDIFVNRALLGVKIRRARFVRSISRFNRRFLEVHFPTIAENKTHVIHVGVDTRHYRGSALAARAEDAPPRILCVAALQTYKGIPVLLEACAELRESGASFRCEIIGDGPLRRRLQRQIERRSLQHHVHLLGARTQQEVRAHMRLADVVVLPSIVAPDGQMEGIPVVLMEALAADRPVVAADLSGIPELIEDGQTGLLFEPKNAAQLTSAIRWLLKEPALGQRLARRGRHKVEREFRLDATVARLLALIDRENEPPELLVTELAQFAADALRCPESPLGVVAVHRRRESTVVEVSLMCGGVLRQVVVKQHRAAPNDPFPATRRAQVEHRVLARLHKDEAEHGHAPAPLLLNEGAAVIVMDRCKGRALSNILRHDTPAATGEAVAAAGRWLHHFHDMTGETADPTTGLANLRACTLDHLEACRAGGGVTRRTTRRLRRRIETLATKLAATAPPMTLCHGDFWPGNVFVDAGRAQCIDFEGAAPGFAAQDSAYFLVQLQLFFNHPLAWRHWRRLRQIFLAETAQCDPALWQLAEIDALLMVLRRSYLAPASFKQRLCQATLRRALRRGAS